MKLGLMIANQYLTNESMEQKINENLEQVCAAREAGFSLVCAGEHYLSSPYQMPTLFPLLARISAEAGGMRVASGVTLLPLHNPVELAETVATMDSLCGGQFVFGVGLGYREEEFEAFGINKNDRVPRFLEALEIMKLLWTGEEVGYRGKFYNVPNIKSTCRTIQQPYPPIWIAANNDTAIKRAGTLGHTWYINPHVTLPTIERQMELYRQSLKNAGNSEPKDLPIMREVYVDDSREKALRTCAPILASKYQAYAGWGQDKALPSDESFSDSFTDLMKDRFIIGTPSDLVEAIKHYEARLGVNLMILRIQWPGMGHQDVIRQIKLLEHEVIPLI
ncbi:LLM class flavin-dependent oxidoreductase [SAR202 cluster bacterium AD-802-E10_MRT_200m]|nr:LLM class flavin-dependent oxidoreductase [SAR202 cluster bacterium AD-802-E10_MRT_200m]